MAARAEEGCEGLIHLQCLPQRGPLGSHQLVLPRTRLCVKEQHLPVCDGLPLPITALTSNPTSADREPGFTWLMKMPGFWMGPLEMLREAELWVRLMARPRCLFSVTSMWPCLGQHSGYRSPCLPLPSSPPSTAAPGSRHRKLLVTSSPQPLTQHVSVFFFPF